MNTARILLLSLMILAIVCLASVSCGGKQNKATTDTGKTNIPTTATIIIDSISHRTDTLRLGKVREGETILREISLINRTSTPIVIMNIDGGCGCLLFEYSKKPVEAHSESEIKLRFYSDGLRGDIERFAKIKLSNSDSPLELIVTANVQ